MIQNDKKDTLDTVVLHGHIQNLQVKRFNNYELNKKQKKKHNKLTDLAALALAAIGKGGQAIGVSSNRNNPADQADRVSFNLGDKLIKGWLWRCPLQEGDVVEVIVQPTGSKYELFAVRRPSDRLLAVYPRATCGRCAFFKRNMGLGGCLFVGILAFMIIAMLVTNTGNSVNPLFYAALMVIFLLIFCLITAWAYHKDKEAIRIAENNFRHWSWPNVEYIDLQKDAFKLERPEDDITKGYGTFYFRYDEKPPGR